MTTDPRSTYLQLLELRRAEIAHLQQRHRLLGYAKLGTASLGILVVALALTSETLSILWVLLPVAGFVALVVVHEAVMRHMERIRRAERYFVAGIGRLDGDWSGAGEPGDRYLDPEHPYA